MPAESTLRLLRSVLLDAEDDSASETQILVNTCKGNGSRVILAVVTVLVGHSLSLFRGTVPGVHRGTRLLEYIRGCCSDSGHLLPIIVANDGADLARTFLLTLRHALTRGSLLSVVPRAGCGTTVCAVRG